MGIKYQVINSEGKPIARTKEAWEKYKKKEGFSLELWDSKGNGWLNLCSKERRCAGMPRGKWGMAGGS
jgi:hypothetical protein